LNKDKKVKDNKQKPTDVCPAGTAADSEPQPKTTTSRPACSNTFVSRFLSSVLTLIYIVYACLVLHSVPN